MRIPIWQKITLCAGAAVITACTFSSTPPSLDAQTKHFEDKYYKQGEAIFVTLPVASIQEDTVTLEDGSTRAATRLQLADDGGVLGSGWSIAEYTQTGKPELVIFSEKGAQHAFRGKEILVTKNSYPQHRPGWYISGHYACVEEAAETLSCIGLSGSPVIVTDDENKTYHAKVYEFPM